MSIFRVLGSRFHMCKLSYNKPPVKSSKNGVRVFLLLDPDQNKNTNCVTRASLLYFIYKYKELSSSIFESLSDLHLMQYIKA